MKLLLSDLDGTLLTPDKTLSPRVLDRIERWKEEGNVFVIATGRVVSSARVFADLTDTADYLIACSGACIYEGDQKVYEEVVPLEIAKKLWRLFSETGEYCQIYSDEALIYNNWNPFLKAYQGFHSKFGEKYELPMIEMRDFDESLLPGGIHKLSFVNHDPDRAKEVIEHLGDLSEVNVFRSLSHLYDIISIKADKGIAGKWLKERIGASKFYAIGDNENDVAMLEMADYAAVMEDAPPTVLPRADRIVAHSGLDGVADFIDDLLEEEF